jgi:hypothetical protein
MGWNTFETGEVMIRAEGEREAELRGVVLVCR